MKSFNWKTSPEDQALVRRIVARANRYAARNRQEPIEDLDMDLIACHNNGCELDLRGLLDAEAFDFVHDVHGIHHHLDRRTGRLVDHFEPRYSKSSQRIQPKAPPRKKAVRLAPGFTLIELLATIGVVGMLIGLLMPALASSIATGRRVACSANLRGLGQATAMYRDANAGAIPVAVWPAHAATSATAPYDALSGFLSANLPTPDWAAREARTGQPWACPADPYAEVTGFSYAYAPMIFFQVLGDTRHRAIYRAFAEADAVLFLDSEPVHPGDGPSRHNAAFSDGSVRQFLGRVCTLR